MSRNLIRVLALAQGLAAGAAILPERLGDFQRTAVQSYRPAEEAVFREYGFDAGESAHYQAAGRRLEMIALRAKDSTGAFGMFQWLRPADAQPVEIGERAVESGQTAVFQFGNYVFILRGARPEMEHLETLLSILPRFESNAAPPLAKQLPRRAVVPNSERHVLGPVVLEKLASAIPPSVAAFHLGAEAQIAEYAVPGGRLKLALFGYPTPHLARAQLEEFQKQPRVVAKRSGPLIAAVIEPFSPDEAEKLLALVRYEATVTLSQQSSGKDNVGDLILNILLLIVIIGGFMLMAGLGVGGGRVLLSRLLPSSRFDNSDNPHFIRLDLGPK